MLKRRSLGGVLVAWVAVAAPVAVLVPSNPAVADASTFYKIGYDDGGTTYLVNPDGSSKQLFATAFSGDFDWTPDGEKFVYRTNQSPGQLRIRNQDGSEFPVGTIGGIDPALSPDGTKIAYTRYDETLRERVVDVVDVYGNFVATLGPGTQPTWSPDGTKIAFSKDGERTVTCDAPPTSRTPPPITLGSDGLAVASATGGGSSWLIEPVAPAGGDTYWYVGSAPDWSPDGTAIVLHGYEIEVYYNPDIGNFGACGTRLSDADVYRVASGGGSPVNLTNGADWIGAIPDGEPADLNASFSPDGEQIAFASTRNRPRDGGIHSLWKMDAGGGSPTLVRVATRVDHTDWMTALPAGEAVRIDALDPCATEEGTTPGTFTIKRTGATDGAVDVTVEVASSSTATSGPDFQEIPTTVTIPDGSNLVNLVVFPNDDDVAEPEETIDVEIVSAEGLLVGEPSKGTIAVADNDGGTAGSCAQTPTHKRSITLAAKHVGTSGSKMLKLSGVLSVADDADGCIGDAKVSLDRFKAKTKRWVGVGDDTTDQAGRYAFQAPDIAGKYRAKVKPRNVTHDGAVSSCSATTTTKVHEH